MSTLGTSEMLEEDQEAARRLDDRFAVTKHLSTRSVAGD